MSGQKKGFAQFIRPTANTEVEQPTQALASQGKPLTSTLSRAGLLRSSPLRGSSSELPAQVQGERVRQVTATGRVRTHSANRALPGVTLRLTEERWEKLKMLSIQQRRPIQDILGEALEGFMRAKGLPW